MIESRYVYPQLPCKIEFGIRFMGAGLANCLFVYARALLLAEQYGLPLINPAWVQFNLGPYLRNEKDKRHYNGLFKPFGVSGWAKYWLLLTRKKYVETTIPTHFKTGILQVQGLVNYFGDLHFKSDKVRNHLLSIVNPQAVIQYNQLTYDFIGVHIRLGDYAADSRTDLDWYIEKMTLIREQYDPELPFLIFSDGSPEQLKPVLDFPTATMAFFGSAIADILLLSKARLILASDSTFSAWAAYLGQVPIVFNKRHFGPVLDNPEQEWVQQTAGPAMTNDAITAILRNRDIN